MGAGEEPERRLDRVVLGSGEAPEDRLAATAAGLAVGGLRITVTGTDDTVLEKTRDRLAVALTPRDPASQVADPALRWLPLPVRGDLPLTTEELQRLVRLHARTTPEHERRRRQAFPPVEAVPTDEEVRVLADRVTRGDLAARQLDPGLREVLERADAGEVLATIREVKARLGEVLRHRRAWVVRVVDVALDDPGAETWQRLSAHADGIEHLLRSLAELGDAVVEGVEPSEEAAQAFGALQDELAAGQPARRWFRGRTQRTAARLLESARVDGEPVTDVAGASTVRRFLEVAAESADLEQQLGSLGVPVPPDTPRDGMVAGYAEVLEALRAISRLVDASRRLVQVLGPGPVEELPVASLEDAERVGWAGDALAAVREGEQARRELETAANTLEQAAVRVAAAEHLDQPAPEVAELVLCLRAAADQAYADWHVKMAAARRARRLAVLREELTSRLAEGAPGLPALLEADATEASWAPRIARWDAAWAAARELSEAMAGPAVRVVAIPELIAQSAAGGRLDVLVVHDPTEEHTEDQRLLDLAPRTVVVTRPAGPREVVLELASTGPVSGAEVRAATGLTPARSRTLLQQLVDAGELVRTGATSATRWHRADPVGDHR
ncbi:MAG: hypothetical protein HYU55_14845 [Nocardioides sp.]|nr:hypothetical protein [Nocardioides sp.]